MFFEKSNAVRGFTVAFMFFLYYFCENVYCAVYAVQRT